MDSYISSWSETQAGTGSGATASHAAASGTQHFVSCISGHVDADSIIQILDHTTVVWESKIDVSVEGFSFSFYVGNIPITPGNKADGKIASSSADCQVNLGGSSIP